MNSKSYKTIFTLLSACILFILVIQAFWIKNTYEQKQVVFNSNVYSALDYVNNKLQERENLKSLGQTIIIERGDTIIHTSGNRQFTVTSNSELKNGAKISQIKKNKIIIQQPPVRVEKTIDSLPTNTSESLTWEVNTDVKEIEKATINIEKNVKEVDELLKKVYLEIKATDSKESDVNAVNELIKKALKNKGLFFPFEFSLRKIHKENTKIICQTEHFKDTDPYIISDLSASKVFSTHKYLWLQFPNQNKHVLAGMKSSLALSLFFSLMILGVFFHVMRLIIKQKKFSEIKNDFINNMTHELKTPIATISLALDAINNPVVKNDGEKFKDYSRILKEENQKLNKHVERVLQMALLDKGELALHFKEVDLLMLINEVVASYKLQIEEHKAKVEVITSLSSLKMKGDEEHLKVVFSNLLDNALKYSKPPCEIKIAIQQVANEIEIIFKDNGIGIDAKNHSKIFDKFYREQGGNLHDVKGFGIGLSYAQSIVEKHNGTIRLQSEKGKGSSFIILFKI